MGRGTLKEDWIIINIFNKDNNYNNDNNDNKILIIRMIKKRSITYDIIY